MPSIAKRFLFSLACTLLLQTIAQAETPEEFYKGKTVSIYVATSPGAGYDLNARLIGKYIGRYIPGNPTVIIRNMPGSGGVVMCNYIATSAPKDGLSIGAPQRPNAFEPLLGGDSGLRYDPLKLQWLGNTSADTGLTVATRQSGIKSWTDLKTRELIVAIAGVGSGAERLSPPAVLRNLLGLKFKVVGGYSGGAEMDLAMMRGEVDGRAIYSWDSLKDKKEQWLDTGALVILFQMGLRPNPELPDVPLVTSFGQTDDQRKILELMVSNFELGRPLFVADGVPADRVDALRHAFDQVMKDKDFLADAASQKLEVNPMAGEDVQDVLQRIYATPRNLIDQFIQMNKLDPG